MSSSNAIKKAKTEKNNQNIEFNELRRYILQCPHISKESPAIKAALSGLDQELKRRARDEKLRNKFTGGRSSSSPSKEEVEVEVEVEDDWQDIQAPSDCDDNDNNTGEDTACTATKEHKNNKHNPNDDTKGAAGEEEEVEIIVDNVNEYNTTSVVGKQLASISVSSIVQFQQKAKSPLAAIAMALHAALRSDILGFICTGIPDEKSSSTGGFAKPIRDIPKTSFLPTKWDKDANHNSLPKVILRYRKKGMGSILLNVTRKVQQEQVAKKTTTEKEDKDGNIHIEVQVVPTSSQEPPNECMVFSIDQHINLDSWAIAARADSNIPPALHYKGLSELLTNFTKTFDLGHINDNENEDHIKNEKDSTDQSTKMPVYANNQSRRVIVNVGNDDEPWKAYGPSTTNRFVPGGMPIRNNPDYALIPTPVGVGGDFSSDLLPCGGMGSNPLGGAGFAPPGVHGSTGNIMGPNHPFFGRVGVGGSIPGGGMQPRFDPFGPPGGPQEIYPPGFPGVGLDQYGRPKKDPRLPPGGSGVPNNDILRPPDNMFM